MIIREYEKAPIVFHFNKGALFDAQIPMWVLKIKGETFYVTHVEVKPNVGFNTKESPTNEHTKGSLKFNASVRIFTALSGQLEAVVF
jgi:hypothetical protein